MTAVADVAVVAGPETMLRVEDPVAGTDLLDDLQAFLRRYVDLPTDEHYLILAAWIVHTWTLPAAFITPYLYISSTGPGSGKTRLMDVLGVLCRNPDSGTDSPPHVLAQEIASNEPTLFFDEIDTVWGGGSHNALKRILNMGYQRGAAIKRQRANVVERWPVFCPKVLAGIRNNHLPESLLSRCIPVEMEKRSREIERFNRFHVLRDQERVALVDRIAELADQHMIDIANQRPEALKALDDRQNEIVEPLLAVASALDRETDVRRALARIFRKDSGSQSREQIILERIRDAFDSQALRGGPSDRIFTEDVLGALGPMYNAHQLGILLAEMGFARSHPETLRIDTQVKRGYHRDDFSGLFDRWLDTV